MPNLRSQSIKDTTETSGILAAGSAVFKHPFPEKCAWMNTHRFFGLTHVDQRSWILLWGLSSRCLNRQIKCKVVTGVQCPSGSRGYRRNQW